MYLETRHHHKPILSLGLILFLSCGSVWSGDINKWVDEEGKTHYGAQPPANQKPQRIKTPASVAAPAKQDEPEIILYSTSWCGYCKKARAYLNKNNIAFKEKDIEKDFRAKREHKMLGGRGVPLLVRDGKETRAGFSPSSYNRFFRGR